MSSLFAVIMAGGSGTRFWPASRRRRPKQLLALGGPDPLLLATSRRLQPLIPAERQLVVTSAALAEAVRDLLPDVPPTQVIGEPEGRDTAPCIGLAAAIVAGLDPDATVVALPSDHVVAPEELFREHLAAAEAALAARPEALLVFGIEADRAATGYGWIKRGAAAGEFGGRTVYALDRFVEKPDAARAAELLASGDHLWNAGLFAFKPAALAAAYAAHLPQMTAPLERMARAFPRDEFEQVLLAEFRKLPKVSIDHGVMEHVAGALVLPLPVRWDDLGDWNALARLREPGADGNTVEGDVLALQSSGNVLVGRDGLVAVRGVDGLIVVHTPDATLVCRRDDEQGVKQIVEALAARGWERYL